MKHAISRKEISGLRVRQLDSHPFNLELPHRNEDNFRCAVQRIFYIGTAGGTEESVEGMLRIISQRISQYGHTVYHLRSILCGDENGSDVFYEVAVDDALFISGGCTDCSGEGGSGKETVDGVFNCLSACYATPFQTMRLDFHGRDAQTFVSNFIRDHTKEWGPIEPPVKGRYTFQRGERVRFSDFGRRHKPVAATKADTQPNRIHLIEGTEDIFQECDCGLGSEVPVILHPEKCGLWIGGEQMHHQFVHVKLGDRMHRLSGINFEPA